MVNVTADTGKFLRAVKRAKQQVEEMKKAGRTSGGVLPIAKRIMQLRRDRDSAHRFATNYLWPGKRRFQPSFDRAIRRLREMFVRAAVVSSLELLPWQEKMLEGLVYGPPRRRRRMLQGLGHRCGHSYTLGKLAEAKGVSVVNRGDGSKTSSVGEELLWALMQGAE